MQKGNEEDGGVTLQKKFPSVLLCDEEPNEKKMTSSDRSNVLKQAKQALVFFYHAV